MLAQWVDWLAPDEQPFFVTPEQAAAWSLQGSDRPLTRNERDTFLVYDVDSAATVAVWLNEGQFTELAPAVRAQLVRAQASYERGAVPTVRRWQHLLGPELRRQADGHRFVWWKSILTDHAAEVLPAVVSEYLGPSRHTEVNRWPASLPRAQELAGTFPPFSGPNCFGTVMAAAGVEGADITWMLREPFETWLAENTTPGGRDDQPGTVFVWRATDDGRVNHAAITLGDGWMLHKPSQSWWTPRKVRTVAEVRRSKRDVGQRLFRRTLTR
nr:hypothetical protein [Kribbella sandramycini]